MTRYSPNHPAVMSWTGPLKPQPMTIRRKTTVALLLITAVATINLWFVSIPATITAWLTIWEHKARP